MHVKREACAETKCSQTNPKGKEPLKKEVGVHRYKYMSSASLMKHR